MNRVIAIFIGLFSSLAYSQDEYLYVNAEDSGKYDVSITLEKEEYYNRWCMRVTYPPVSSYLKDGEFDRINYLLKRDYKEAGKDKAPAMYLNLESINLESKEVLETELCLAKEYYRDAEIQIHYHNNSGINGGYHNIIVWIQNIDLLINKISHNEQG